MPDPVAPGNGEQRTPRVDATRAGRWGIRQFHKGNSTGGGTVGMGWSTETEAREQNPPYNEYTYEPFERSL